jgi:hypothetical protein
VGVVVVVQIIVLFPVGLGLVQDLDFFSVGPDLPIDVTGTDLIVLV